MPHDHATQNQNPMTSTPPATGQQLAEILDLATLLPDLLDPRHGAPQAGERPTPTGRAHSPAPVRLDVLQALDTRPRVTGDDAPDRVWHDRQPGPWHLDGTQRWTRTGPAHRQGLLPDLQQWARRYGHHAPPVTLSETISVLLARLDWALEQPWAGDLVVDVDWWWRHLRNLAGERHRDPYLPRCKTCQFPVSEVPGPVGDDGREVRSGVWRCEGCGRETLMDVELGRLAEPLVTLAEAAELTGVPITTLKSRVKAGTLLAVLQEGRPARYPLREITTTMPQ